LLPPNLFVLDCSFLSEWVIGKFENKKEAAALIKNIEAKEKAKAVIFQK